MRLILTLIVLFALAASPAAAQPVAEGTAGELNAFSFADIPTGAPVWVEPYDDTLESLELLEVFQRQLQVWGYRIDESATMLISFSTFNGAYRGSSIGANRVELSGDSGTGGRGDVDVRVKVFSNQLGKQPTPQTVGRFALETTIQDRASGQRVWQAELSTPLRGQASEMALAKAMVPIMVEYLGQPARSQSVVLR